MKYRADIDGLRSVAVLPVVLYHAGFHGLSGGFVGVDVFFVISGFLITTIIAGEIAQGRFSLVRFYEKRARRILPALTVVVLSCFAVGWFVLLPEEFRDLGQSALATALFLSNAYFNMTLDYFGQSAEFAPLLHTWSLAVEEQFYLFFPPLLMLLALRPSWRLSWVVAVLSVLSFVAAVVMLPMQPDWVFYQIFFRAWELGAGALLALTAFAPPTRRATRELLGCVGLAGILLPVTLYDATTSFPGAAAVPPVLGATLLIWIGAKGGGSTVNRLLGWQPLVWIGLISYSLYLWHWPILAYMRITLGTAVLPLGLSVAAVVASIVMAWLSWRFVERPFRGHGPNAMGQRTIFVMSGVALGGIIAAGALLEVTKGLPLRMPAAVTQMAARADDRNPRRAECFGVAPSDGLCTLGTATASETSVDFLFWGDSHADAFMPGMADAATSAEQSGLFAGYSACPPVLNVQRISGGRDCAAFNDEVMSWLESREDMPLVILGARWTLSVEGTRFGGEAGPDVRLEWNGDRTLRPQDTDNAALVSAGLMQTVNSILDTGRQVVLLGPVPEVGRNVPAASARRVLLGWTPEAWVSRADYDARAGATEAMLQQIAAAQDGVRYLPLSDLFCDADICRTTDANGLPLYFDDDHISLTAARNLLPARFQDALGAR